MSKHEGSKEFHPRSIIFKSSFGTSHRVIKKLNVHIMVRQDKNFSDFFDLGSKLSWIYS